MSRDTTETNLVSFYCFDALGGLSPLQALSVGEGTGGVVISQSLNIINININNLDAETFFS